MEEVCSTVVEVEGNVFTLAVSERGLVRLSFGAEPDADRNEHPLIAPYADELRRYFRAELREFTLPLDLRGTPFQKKCWQVLQTIRYGETRTYAEMARAVGSARACRAVGTANGANPIAIIVPCHRVVASDGTLGGYGGGLELKEKLLRLEGAWPVQPGLF